MTRQNERSRRFGNLNNRLRPRTLPPSPWTLKEKVGVWALLLAGMLVTFGVPIVSNVMKRRHSIDLSLESWHRQMGLSDGEVVKLRVIEFNFHCPGNPLGYPSHTPLETHQHHQTLAAALKPGHAEMLLSRLEK